MSPPDKQPTLAETAQWTAVDGLRIRYVEDENRGGPDILLLGLWPETLTGFQQSWPFLAAAGRVVAVDLPGFGPSEHRSDLLSPKTMAAFIELLIERFRLRHPHLVALGMWWTCAIEFALRSPDSLDSMIVGQDLFASDLSAGTETRHLTRDELDREVRVALSRSQVPEAECHEALREMIKSSHRAVLTYLHAHRSACKRVLGTLPSLSTPVMVLSGAHNGAFDRLTSALSEAVPRRRVETIGSGKFAWLEAPAEFGCATADWIGNGYRAAGTDPGAEGEPPES